MSLSASEIQKWFSPSRSSTGVVEEAAGLVGNEDVFALPDRHRRNIATREHLHESSGIGPRDLDLSFDGYVAEDRIVHEVPEVLFRVTEVAWDVHMVVHRELLGSPSDSCVEVGRLADLRAEAELVGLRHADSVV